MNIYYDFSTGEYISDNYYDYNYAMSPEYDFYPDLVDAIKEVQDVDCEDTELNTKVIEGLQELFYDLYGEPNEFIEN